MNSTEEGHICRPPQMGAFLFVVFFSLHFFFSFLFSPSSSLFVLLATPRMSCSWAAKDMIESERKRPIGEPFLGGQRGLGMSYFWVAKWDGK